MGQVDLVQLVVQKFANVPGEVIVSEIGEIFFIEQDKQASENELTKE